MDLAMSQDERAEALDEVMRLLSPENLAFLKHRQQARRQGTFRRGDSRLYCSSSMADWFRERRRQGGSHSSANPIAGDCAKGHST
jgi:hypothetical protein